MQRKEEESKDGSSAVIAKTQKCRPASKWAAVVNDVGIPASGREVPVSVLKNLGGVPVEDTLFRDHSPNSDVPLPNDAVALLSDGNVFYSRAGCHVPGQEPCSGKPKLAWFVDDHHELTLTASQTGDSLRQLFQIPKENCFVRDLESPVDEQLDPEDEARFEDGPVFITRCGNHEGSVGITIIVEGTPHQWFRRKITYEEVVKLEVPEYPQSPPFTYAVTYKCGPSNKPEGILSPTASVKVKERMVFNVSETGQS